LVGANPARIGVTIIRRALEQPPRTLCDNAGAEGSGAVVAVKKEKPDAAPVAGLLLTTEALITEIPEKKKNRGNPGQSGGGRGFDGGDY
jgi:chaperonin GroEL